MVRVLASDDRGEAGVFAPVERPRLIERLRAAAEYPVALIVAPAGYGKSLVLRQYLASATGAPVRFALRAEHAELLGFLRGFAEALRAIAPHAITALAGAYERNTSSPKRAAELARWMDAHLESYSGTIAIDDFHVADAEVAKFLAALIESSKGRVRWILASRSTTGLPVGTWLAYRDADLPIGEQDLRFTLDEAREAARTLHCVLGEGELEELLALTEGWPAAMSFALRTSMRSEELRNVSALTREMIYRLLAEQVYAELDDDERELLELAMALPAIDVAVLERAGLDRALPIVERLRERTAFIHEDSPGVYHCHDLFRDFLRRQSALSGRRSQQAVSERAARALEEIGDAEHAIGAYAAGGSTANVVRLLERHGFELIERARSDVVARAIAALDETTRHENATALALQGALHAIAGKFARAESLFRRALARAGSDRDLVATTSLRLAALLANQGGDVTDILDPVFGDAKQEPGYRAGALALSAAERAMRGDISTLAESTAAVEDLLPLVACDVTRAKVLYHLGIAARHGADVQGAFARLTQAAETATDLHLFGLASRIHAALANLSLHHDDDVALQLRFAQLAADAAIKAGDSGALRTALLQMLSGHMRRGESEASIAIERRLLANHKDALVVRYVTIFRAVRLAWSGQFAEAHPLMSSRWNEMLPGIDSIACGAQLALFLALDNRGDASSVVVVEVIGRIRALKVSVRFDLRSLMISRVFCILAEHANGRHDHAERAIRRLKSDDPVERAVIDIGKRILRSLGDGPAPSGVETAKSIANLMNDGYGDVALILRSAHTQLNRSKGQVIAYGRLTTSELEILRLLADGRVPKEIAEETSRSVNTVRVHITNTIEKLNCRGSRSAIKVARERGLI